MKKIMVVEDDWELNKGICVALQRENYETFSAYSLEEARDSYLEHRADMILLDVNLPDGEGFSFCKWMKVQQDSMSGSQRDAEEGLNIPFLFLTARDLEEDALTGYELGADDYITKPFSMKILLKKIDVIFRRIPEERNTVFDDGFLLVDLDRARVEAGGKECSVTPTEFRLLRQFMEHKGQLLTYSVLLERLWDHDALFVDKHTLAVNVNRLRGKIEDGKHRYISNVYGMGYQWLG